MSDNKILDSTKDFLGVPLETTVFDSQLVGYINMAFSVLNQVGFGPAMPYQVTLEDGDLDDFLPNEEDEGIKSVVQLYIYTKVRLLFDPPATSFVLAALQATASEYEWRLANYTSPVVET